MMILFSLQTIYKTKKKLENIIKNKNYLDNNKFKKIKLKKLNLQVQEGHLNSQVKIQLKKMNLQYNNKNKIKLKKNKNKFLKKVQLNYNLKNKQLIKQKQLKLNNK